MRPAPRCGWRCSGEPERGREPPGYRRTPRRPGALRQRAAAGVRRARQATDSSSRAASRRRCPSPFCRPALPGWPPDLDAAPVQEGDHRRPSPLPAPLLLSRLADLGPSIPVLNAYSLLAKPTQAAPRSGGRTRIDGENHCNRSSEGVFSPARVPAEAPGDATAGKDRFRLCKPRDPADLAW
jgi:hypothetical protein